MLSSLLRTKRGHKDSEQTPLLFRGFQAFRNHTHSGDDTEDEEHDNYDEDEYDEENDEDEDEDEQPVLPIFSIPVLGIYEDKVFVSC